MTGGKRLVYRCYRSCKRWALEHPGSFLSNAFFRLLMAVEERSRGKSQDPLTAAADEQWRAQYRARFPVPPYRIDAEKPLAIDSDDARFPRGALNDSSTNRAFNSRCYQLFASKPDFSLLDLGCAGGGLVRSVLEDGYTAVGVEGSDAAKKAGRGEWRSCEHHLFHADITAPFSIRDAGDRIAQFDVVTAWEVLEHIPEERLTNLVGNIERHLARGGIFIASVDTAPDGNPLLGAVYHQTLRPREWWLELFARHGMRPVEGHPFTTADYVRGNGGSFKDWDPEDGEGFHLVLKKSPD